MPSTRPPRSITEVLDRLDEAREHEEKRRVALRAIFDVVGRRAFGPLLLLAGVIVLAPGLGDIPGVPTVTGVFVLVMCGQLLLGRNYFWLPNWLLDRSVSKGVLRKAVRLLRSPAKFVDRLLRPRLTFFTGPAAHYATAAVAAIVAVVMPAMEIVPFSANVAGAALTAFGLSLVAHDGLFGLFGFTLAGATFAVVVLALR